MPKCKVCKYWDKDSVMTTKDEEQYQSICRRSPPNMCLYQAGITSDDADDIEQDQGFWPWTLESDWCGEFKERDK